MKKEGLEIHKVPPELRRHRQPSVHILADNHLKDWPIGDNQCQLMYFEHLPLSQWVEKLWSRTIIIQARIVVLYLHKFKNFMHGAPLKNRITQICHAIRATVGETWIFICNLLPAEGRLQLDDASRYNRQLFTSTQHVNQELERVFLLDMFAHFVDIQGRTIEPMSNYITTSGSLTLLGAFIFWGCLLQEVGVTGYSL